MAKIGVIGLGAVGTALIHGMSLYHECIGYDVNGEHNLTAVLDCKTVFVCVPTPEDKDGRLDCSAMSDVLKLLSEKKYTGIVVIKSTVRIGFFEEAESAFKTLRLVYMPEFLRERSRFTWFLNPDRLVISGKKTEVDSVLLLFDWVKGIPIIRTDHRTAEVGKLAHNAYIATKVSFTNEMETISSDVGANADIVMKIVASDRRVASMDHLKPGMGSYGGKCVPKDTSELSNASNNSVLLKAVQSVRGSFPVTSRSMSHPRIFVIIPTKNRSNKIGRALTSISHQSVLPDGVVVVSDCNPEEEERTKRIIDSFDSSLKIEMIANTRTHNISGAINFGIEHLLSEEMNLDESYLALLDDDDWWDRMYLDNLSTFASEAKADWIISGIIRHEDSNSSGIYKSIPATLSVDDFLVGNPNIQGSNLFVRTSRVIEAGGFDENLPSTTDRDISIRLLKLRGIEYAVLRNHLMHHDASGGPTRLSSPASEMKRKGLEAFFKKYEGIMSRDQKVLFKQRAKNLFNVEIE